MLRSDICMGITVEFNAETETWNGVVLTKDNTVDEALELFRLISMSFGNGDRRCKRCNDDMVNVPTYYTPSLSCFYPPEYIRVNADVYNRVCDLIEEIEAEIWK